MNKKILYMTVGLIVTLTLLTGVYAVTSIFTTTQTLTVPTYSVQVFQSDGTTPITPAQNITSLWIWKDDTKRFELDIKIKNTGTTAFTPTITTAAITGWTLTTTTLTPIAAGSTLSVTVIMTPSTSTGGETTGSFVLNINRV